MPAHVGLQGNLDPAIVAAGWGPTEPAVRDVLRRGGGNPGGRGGHIFNLGHGVLPETDPETLERVVELVHSTADEPDRAAPQLGRPVRRATRTVGVVVMAYGTPATPEDIEPYYTHIRRGRPPTQEQLDELTERYAAIGGISPLAQRTRAQLEAITAALDDAEPGTFRGATRPEARGTVRRGRGRRRWQPTASTGSSGSCWRRTTPGFSVGQYNERRPPLRPRPDSRTPASSRWSLEPAFVEHQAASVRDRLAALPERTKVVFTAHSLPERVLEGDPYPDQLRASAEAIAERAGLGRWATWSIGWQSAGRTPEPWRGPDILDIIRELAADRAGRRRPRGAPGVHLGPPRGDLRPGHRSRGRRGGGWAGVRPHRRRQRRPAVTHGRPWRNGSRELAGVNPSDHLVIVGGGITGLAAAWEASAATTGAGHGARGREPARRQAPHLDDRRSTTARELRIDEGADAFLARVPDAVRLCHELGLDDELTQPAIGRAKVFSDGELKFLPERHGAGRPTRPGRPGCQRHPRPTTACEPHGPSWS